MTNPDAPRLVVSATRWGVRTARLTIKCERCDTEIGLGRDTDMEYLDRINELIAEHEC